MCDGGKSETGGDAYKRADSGGTVERGSFLLPGFCMAYGSIRCRINGLLGRKYAVDREAAFRIPAVTDLMAQVGTQLGEQGVVIGLGQIAHFNFTRVG